MKRLALVLSAVIFILSACAAPPQETPAQPATGIQPADQSVPTAASPSDQPPTKQAETPPASQPGVATQPGGSVPTVVDTQGQGLPLISIRGTYFNGSGNCAVCHTKMVDMSGKDVSNDRLWRSTMMGNAARDPYWQASVTREVLSNPGIKAAIEDKCSTCHMPMARFTAFSEGGKGEILGQGFADPAHANHGLAIDGVSCTVCHQIQPGNLGSEESFSGGYAIDILKPVGERSIYGPFAVPPNLAVIMQGVSGFLPEQSLHVIESSLCGTCHNLYTPYLDAQDQIAGKFPEQMIFSEWLNSDYSQQKSCQDCHMPLAQGSVRLSTTGGPPRSPFFQHNFVGGNQYLPQLFQQHLDELSATASQANFDTTIQNVQDLLQNQTASVKIEAAQKEGNLLTFQVSLQSQVGHKLPAGFPSRRAWLHVRVTDSSGNLVFESGGYHADGSIIGNINDEDPQQYEPHYLQIDSADQVQIYEAIMVDTQAEPTTVLMRSAGYAKDNRLLPLGFDKLSVPVDVGVFGEAVNDPDFLAGGDTCVFQVDLGTAGGPFNIQVELLYQTIGFRWAQNLIGYESMETQRFVDYYTQTPNLPFIITSASQEGIN